MKQFFSNPWTIGTLIVLAIGGIILWFRNNNGGALEAPATKCCTKRDQNCRCTEHVWKKSSECEAVPCPPYVERFIIDNVNTVDGRPTGNNGLGGGIGVGTPVGGLGGLAGGGFVAR